MPRMLPALLAAVLILLGAVPAVTASAQEAGCPSPCLKADGDGFAGSGSGTTPRQSSGNSSSGGGGGVTARPVATTITEKNYVPTCTGNSAEENGLLCGAAVETCSVPGEVRFWLYTRQVDLVDETATPWVRQPDTYCLGADEPAIDPAVAIAAMVQRDFQRVVVLRAVADVSPRPDTLVNVPTRFRTSTPRSYDIPLTLLGRSVVITARAERYTWHFGDGESATTREDGAAVEHTYLRAGGRQAHVVVEWSGTFTIDGGAPQSIAGTATTTGEPVAVQVRQARTELVRD